MLDLDRARRRAVHDEPEARQVVLRALRFGNLEDADEVRGRHEAQRDAMRVDESEPLPRVPPRQDHRGRADEQRRHHVAARPRVVRRPGEQVHVLRAASPRARPDPAAPACARDRVERAVHDPLRPARRSRRVEHRRGQHLARREIDRCVGAGLDQRVHEVEVVDEHLRLRVLDDVRDFVRLEVRVHEHDRALQLRDRGPDLEERDGVREHDRDPVGDADPARGKPARDEIGTRVEVDERGDQAVLDERGLVRSARRVRARAKLGGIHGAERRSSLTHMSERRVT